jgi:hypothetical protein
MNPRNTALLVTLAAGLFAFIFFFERHIHPPVPPPPRVLPGFNPATVTSIEVQPAAGFGIRAERTNGTWQLTKPLPYPAQEQNVEGLLRTLAGLSYETRIAAPEPNIDFGFDKPRFIILIEDGSERRQLNVGRFTAPGDQVYVQVVGQTAVDVVGIDFLKTIPREASNWRDTVFVNLGGIAFDRLSVANGARVFELSRDPTNLLWRMTAPIPARADSPKVEELLYRLQNLRVSRFVTDAPGAELEPLGLQPPQCEVALFSGTNALLSVQFGSHPADQPDLVYARVKGHSAVVLVPYDQVDAWRASHEQFRDPRLAGTLAGPPDFIEVRGAESFRAQRLTNDLWLVFDQARKLTLQADTNLMRAFIEKLAGLQIAASPGKFAVNDAVLPENLPAYGLATNSPSLRTYALLRAIAMPGGGQTNQVLAELDFGSEADGKIYARRGDLPGESSVYVVKLEDFQSLPATGIALRERRIWSFTDEKVSWISVRQNGVSRKLLHRGPNAWGLAADSQGIIDMSDQFETEAAVGELGALSAWSWVAVGDQARAKYGFTDNGTRISLGLAGGTPPTLDLDLGGWSPRKLRYGAVQLDGQTWVFEVPADVLQRVEPYLKIQDSAGP